MSTTEAGPQARAERIPQEDEKGIAVDGAFDFHAREQPRRAHGPDERAVGRRVARHAAIHQAHPFGSTSVAAGQVQVAARLVQKDQPPGACVYLADALAEGRAFSLVGFAGEKRLFLRGSPSASMTR